MFFLWILRAFVLCCLIFQVFGCININFLAARRGEGDFDITQGQYICHFSILFILDFILCLLFTKKIILSIQFSVGLFCLLWIVYLFVLKSYSIVWVDSPERKEKRILRKMNAVIFALLWVASVL